MASPTIARATFTVVSRAPNWSLEQDGVEADVFRTREEAMACATRRANASQNAGRPAQIRFADGSDFGR